MRPASGMKVEYHPHESDGIVMAKGQVHLPAYITDAPKSKMMPEKMFVSLMAMDANGDMRDRANVLFVFPGNPDPVDVGSDGFCKLPTPEVDHDDDDDGA